MASPPSSRIMFGPPPSGQRNIWSVHCQYSSSDSPFQAKTGTPSARPPSRPGPTTTAAAAWSWVEKMLQDAQRTSAPRATSVSISTAVCTVMCNEPEMRAPASGCGRGVLAPDRHQAGHLVLGELDLLPPEVRRGTRSATLKSKLMRSPCSRPAAAAASNWMCLSCSKREPFDGRHVRRPHGLGAEPRPRSRRGAGRPRAERRAKPTSLSSMPNASEQLS